MDTAMNRAVPPSAPTRSERLSNLADCAVTAVFVLSGIDLRAVAWGGIWLRDVATLKNAPTNA